MPSRRLAGSCIGALVALATIACRRAEPPFAGPFAHEDARPPTACGPLPLAHDTAGWVALPVFGGKLSLRVPAGFMVDTTADFMHGGRRWRRGRVWVEEAGGHWGYSSFRPFPGSTPPRRYSECETRVGRFSVFLAEREAGGRLNVYAWVRDTAHVVRGPDGRTFATRPDVLLVAQGPPRFASLLRTIVWSMR